MIAYILAAVFACIALYFFVGLLWLQLPFVRSYPRALTFISISVLAAVACLIPPPTPPTPEQLEMLRRADANLKAQELRTKAYVESAPSAASPVSRSSPSAAPPIAVTSSSSAAQKLAAVELGTHDVPVSIVAEINDKFERLEAKCQEKRDPQNGKPGIGDIAYTSTQMLKRSGKPMGVLAFLKAMDDSMPAGSETLNLRCAEVAAILVRSMGGRAK